MKNEKGIATILTVIIVFIILLVSIGVMIFVNINHKKIVSGNNQVEIIEQNESNAIANTQISSESSKEETTTNEQYKYELLNDAQMLDWDSIKINGKTAAVKGNFTDTLSMTTESQASEVIKQHSSTAHVYNDGNSVYFDNQNDTQSILTKMEIEKDKDKIVSLNFNVGDEFSLNEIQLAGLKLNAVKEKLGEPYAMYIFNNVMRYYVYRYKDGYILINLLIKTNTVHIVKKDYTGDNDFYNNLLKNINA